MEHLLLSCTSLGLATCWAVGAGYRAVSRARRRYHLVRCRQQSLQLAWRSAENALHTAVLDPSQAGGNGLQWRALEVAEIVRESLDCQSFYLVDPHGQPLPEFRPGQHLLVRPPMTSASGLTRCYSLSSAPNPDYWRITVKRQIPHDRHQANRLQSGLSHWMHSHLQTGDCLWVAGPAGTFFLPKDLGSPIVCLAAGVGITPMASMIRWSLEHRPQRPIRLFFQARDHQHWPLGETLHGWSRSFPEYHATTCFSQIDESNLLELSQRLPGTFHHGHLAVEQITGCTDVHQAHFFLCGPQAWMDALRHALAGQGVAPERIHWESFASPVRTRANQPGAAHAPQFETHFQRSETSAQWTSDEHSLWELAQESGVVIPSGCLSGVCGCCRVRVLQGQVTYDQEPAIDVPPGECLTCIGRPASNLVLDA
ncbi:MAG: hypothetical protein D6753_10480 [Planctomycetota bacterium]|nr:MAG: hypothetical protein D6753_10480 [Planctomycetota bacterium]